MDLWTTVCHHWLPSGKVRNYLQPLVISGCLNCPFVILDVGNWWCG
jgi:hypothetical protein